MQRAVARMKWRRGIGAGMLILAAITIARGVSYLPFFVQSDRPPAHFLEWLFAPTVWCYVWIIAGGACVAAIFNSRIIPIALGLTIMLHALWAISFFAATITGDSSRGWVSAISYAGIVALAMWGFNRGQSDEIHITRGV